MTDADELDMDDFDEGPLVSPRKFHWAMFPAMMFNLFANMSLGWKQFFDEISASFFAHSTFVTEERVKKEEAKRFQESVDATIGRL